MSALAAPAREGRVVWSEEMTDRLIELYREDVDYPEIARELALPEDRVLSKACTLRSKGLLPKGYRKPRASAEPRVRVWERELLDEVAELRAEGKYRREICELTGLVEHELGEVLSALAGDGRPAGRGKRPPPAPRGPAPRILSDARIEELHAEYLRGASVTDLAAREHVSVRFVYGRFKDLTLALERLPDPHACERALLAASELERGGCVTWHGYLRLRAEHSDWPGPGKIQEVLGDGSWTAAKRAVGIDDRSICERELRKALAADGAGITRRRFDAGRGDHPGRPSSAVVARLLGDGSWKSAKRAMDVARPPR